MPDGGMLAPLAPFRDRISGFGRCVSKDSTHQVTNRLQFNLLSDTPGSELPFYSFIRAGAGMGGEEIVDVELVIHPEGAHGQPLPADGSWARVYRYADPSCTAWVDGTTMPIGELLQQKRHAILAIADGRLIGDAIRRAPAGRGGSRGGRPRGPGGRGGRDAGDAGDAGDDSHARVARGPAPSAGASGRSAQRCTLRKGLHLLLCGP
jgi:hypothetical protein